MSIEAEPTRSSTSALADLVRSLSPSAVLVAGPSSEAIAGELQPHGVGADSVSADAGQLAVTQLARRFDVIILCGEMVNECDEQVLRGVVHFVAGHLLPAGAVVMYGQPRDDGSLADFEVLCAEADLDLGEQTNSPAGQRKGHSAVIVSVHRRSSRFNVHDLLFEARTSIRRLTPQEVMEKLSETEPPLVIDTRTTTDRMRFGVIDGAIHVPRTVVEWHLDPANGYRHPAIHSLDQPIVVVCNGGYSSSLSAANLARIGFSDVADMIGGMAAWIAAELPTVAPTHSHLGY